MSDGAALAIMGALSLVVGLIAFGVDLSMDSAARDFMSAAQCRPGIQGADCLEQRPIEITGTATGRYGAVNSVDFADDGVPQQSQLAPGAKSTWVLKPGASGTATRWRGKYTNLDVSGIDFATDENPVGQQRVWMIVGGVAIAFALILFGASVAWTVLNRRAATYEAGGP